MAEQIKWSQIEAECGDFRAGFVATYKKYEDKPTDERDGQNRVVKVTQSSFARHMGISRQTFHGWVRGADRGQPARETYARQRVRSEMGHMTKSEKAELAAEIVEDLDEDQKQEIVHIADGDRRETHERVKRSEGRLDKEKRQRHTARFIQADGRLGRAKQEIRRATEEARNVEFSDEEQGLLEERIEEIRRELGVAELAIRNTTEIDWDAEFAKLN